MPRQRSGPPRRRSPAPRPARPESPLARLCATCCRGLEALLAEELGEARGAVEVRVEHERVTFRLPPSPSALRRLLVCDRVGVMVREAEGRYVGPRGLAELRGKLARTEFERSLAALPGFGVAAPTGFRVAAAVAPGCDFMFFDVKREATPILARRLGLDPSDDPGALPVEVEVAPEALRLRLGLPLGSWGATGRTPRSLLGAMVRLAEPKPHLSVADPDGGSGELLRVWRAVAGSGRLLGLVARHGELEEHAPWAVVASPRAWPVADLRLSRVLSLNRRLRTPAELAQLLDEIARGLAPGGRAVLLTPAEEAFGRAPEAQPRLTLERSLSVREGGAARRILVLRSEPHPSHHLPRTAGDRERATRELGGVVARRRGRRPRSHDRADTDSRSGERGTT